MEARIHVNTIAVAIDQRNCSKLTEAIDLKPCLIQRSSAARIPTGDFAQLIEGYLKQLRIEGDVFHCWKQFVHSHYHSRVAVINKEYEKGFLLLSQSLQQWLAIYEMPNNSWLIPATRVMAFNLVDIAILADRQCEQTDKHLSTHKHCFEARVGLEDAFGSVCRSGKRLSGLAISNALCKLYFKLDEIQMAIVFQTRVDSQLTVPFEEFPLGDRVVWKYYNGLIAMERLKFREAEECLRHALDQSLSSQKRNVQKLVFLLIPLRLLYNEFPKEMHLIRYGLQRMVPLVRAVRQANVGRLGDFLNREGQYLQTMRIWPVTQKLYNVVYRNILMKCHRYHMSHAPGNLSQQMPLEIFEAGLRVSGMEDITLTEAMNIARVLIQKDMVSGYIALQRKLLVLAKQSDPFPRLRNINLEAGEIFVETE